MCLREYGIDNVKLRHPFVKSFTTSPWIPQAAFTFYRLVVGVYCLAWLLFSVLQSADSKWFLYLSNWAFLFLTAYFILAAFLSTVYYYFSEDAVQESVKEAGGYHLDRPISKTYIRGITSSTDSLVSEEDSEEPKFPSYEDDKLGWCHKVLWVIHTMASVNSLVTTVFYWSMVHRGEALDGLTITLHILNSVFMLLEIVMSHMPVRLLHVIYSHIFLAVYVLFSVIYWAAGGEDAYGHKYVYDALDYESKPGVAVLTVFVLMIVCQPASHVVFYALVSLRRWLVIKVNESW